MAYPEPPASKSAVKKAGAAISTGSATEADYQLVDRWRAAHGYVINTFQAWLKCHIAKQASYVEFAQRLKRRNTVVDKLTRKDSAGKALIADVSAMHDFAGCRMIFNDIQQLNEFRMYMHSSNVMRNVEHSLRHEPGKYDYIENPKQSGYRGIHDVYRHFLAEALEAKKESRGMDCSWNYSIAHELSTHGQQRSRSLIFWTANAPSLRWTRRNEDDFSPLQAKLWRSSPCLDQKTLIPVRSSEN